MLTWIPLIALSASAGDLAVMGIEIPAAAVYQVRAGSLVVEDGSGHTLPKPPEQIAIKLCGDALCPPLNELALPLRLTNDSPSSNELTVNQKRLRGTLWFFAESDGRLRAVNRLPMEDYLVATVGSEMPKQFPPEALKAQAVVSRTYALSRRMRREGEVIQLASSTLDQVYNGLSHESAETRAAVEATRGQVLVFDHEPIDAFFFSSCGGRTRDSRLVFGVDAPYLRGSTCGDCDDASTASWRAVISKQTLSQKLGVKIASVQTEGTTTDGRPQAVVFSPSGPKLAPEMLRKKLGYTVIKSPWLSVSCDATQCTFTGKGAGHGVGMCQWGARGMALKGNDYRSIIQRYFPGSELKTIY